MHKCKFCGKEYETGVKLGGHTVRCKLNPHSKEMYKKMGEKMRGENNPSSNPEVKSKISETVQNKIKNGEWHLSFSKSRTYEYKGIKFHGNWELNYAKFLDENNVKWRRPNEKFYYEFEGKPHYYTPDFFLVDDKKYVEIKGYPTEKDFAKWNQFPLDLQIITGKMLVEMKVIDTYRSSDREYKTYSWK